MKDNCQRNTGYIFQMLLLAIHKNVLHMAILDHAECAAVGEYL